MLSNGYILILIWTAVMGAVAYMAPEVVYRTELVNGEKVRRVTPLFAVAVILPLVIWAGYRGNIGDTGAYIRSYADMPYEFSGLGSYISTVKKDQGYYLFAAIIKCFIGDKTKIYLIIIAALQCFSLFKIYRKYSISYVISFFLFIASTDYISWVFNGVRQFTAATMIVFCFPWIVEKKYVKAIIGILFASLFHQSALLVLPFVFIVQGEAWNKKTLLFLCTVIVAVVFTDQFTDILDKMLEETQYQNVVSDWQMWQDDGTNVFRVCVYCIPALMSLIGLKYIRWKRDPIINVCTNMSIAAAGFYLISMFTSGIFIGRLPIYFSLYSYILLPWLIKNIFNQRSSRLLLVIMVGAYLLFYFYSLNKLNLFL